MTTALAYSFHQDTFNHNHNNQNHNHHHNIYTNQAPIIQHGSANTQHGSVSTPRSSAPVPMAMKQQQQYPTSAGIAVSPGLSMSMSPPSGKRFAGMGHNLPQIHSLSTIETFRKVLDAVDLDDCDPAGENAFLVCDLKKVWDRYTLWQRELGDRVEAFFAVKCNPDPVIIQLMTKLGLGFDCASHQEISQILSYGVSPDRIIYANPCKASSFIRHAAKQNVKMMTFDNLDELTKIKKYHPDAKLVLRILTDDSGSLCQFGIKFGAPLASVRGLLEKARELDIEVIGVSFHVGSGCTNPLLFADAVRRAKWVFEQGKDFGYGMDFLDLGGGFDGETFSSIAAVIRPALEEYFPRQSGVRIIAEPGRYFVSEAFEMATNIIARRGKPAQISQVDGASEQPVVMYYINDGVYGAFNCIMFDHQVVHPKVLSINGTFIPEPELQTNESEYEPCSIWGPTCDSIDCVSKESQLPTKDLHIGDWLRWENMGAYTICAASQFNGFKQARVVYCIDADPATDAKIRHLLT